MGGLGNQMFQYSAARALSIKRGIPFKIDFDDPYRYVQRHFSLDIFNLKAEMATKDELRKCKPKRMFEKRWWMLLGKDPDFRLFKEKKDFQYDATFFECPDGAYISGFWQSEKYFSGIRDIIYKDFEMVQPASEKNMEWLDKINACNAVSVHIRRGDYVKVPKTNHIHGTCDLKYYKDAMSLLTEKISVPIFFFFSDEIDWVKENIRTDQPSYYVDVNDDKHNYEDLRLMSSCKHHIIANSSFSWWGAWLNKSHTKIVIAPRQWMNIPELNTDDLIPASWIRL